MKFSTGGFYHNSLLISEGRFDSKALYAPPLPIHQDRLRNGELFAELLYRLEPTAAMHAHMARLIHRHPKTLELCLENIERTLWLFKVRRSPPVPVHYLIQPEEILKGHTAILWGLLWELMQAYPYAVIENQKQDL